jgi:UDP:flavonoid glycosyltransferase YjiC (YdhE family)
MIFLQRLVMIYLFPLLALFATHAHSLDFVQPLQDVIGSYISGTPFASLFSDPLPPRSEIPLIMTATTHWSHLEKIATIAVELAELGYPIRLICGRVFETYISSLHPNIDFVPALGNDDKMSEEDIQTWLSLPSGEEREMFAMKRVLVDAMPEQHETIQAEAQRFREEFGDRKPMIALFDQTATGHFPILCGAPGIRPDANVGISLAPLTIDSNDTFPFRSGKVPHTGPDARAVHWAAYQERDRNPFSIELDGAFVDKLREMGCTRDTTYPNLQQAMNSEPDYLMTLGIPEFEFPRSDIRKDIRYFGAFKKVGKGSTSEEKPALPSWWDDIAKAKQDGKKILAVSQGTVSMDPNEMVLPTLDALKDRDDILLIATFVSSEPEDVPGLNLVPENTRVAKFVPYDELLPLVSPHCQASSLQKTGLTCNRSISSSPTAVMAPSNTRSVSVSPWSYPASAKTKQPPIPSCNGQALVSISASKAPVLRRSAKLLRRCSQTTRTRTKRKLSAKSMKSMM